MSKDDLYQRILNACREAALAMGDDIRGLSWFWRNRNAADAKRRFQESANRTDELVKRQKELLASMPHIRSIDQ